KPMISLREPSPFRAGRRSDNKLNKLKIFNKLDQNNVIMKLFILFLISIANNLKRRGRDLNPRGE
ncbi:hypothetical protein, partial [Caldisphaera sp.]|uniref:hypothetical protein n=1 Tax=Caldisphaera sp. TaxID=2060322 RepID=UPI0025BF16E3